MALSKSESGFDAAAYLAWGETQPERNEYIAGEVFARVGVGQSHKVAAQLGYGAPQRVERQPVARFRRVG